MAGGTSAPSTVESMGGETENHAGEHETGGNDEISVQGLLGDLADAQDAKAHAIGGTEHNADTLAALNALVSDATLDDAADSRTPTAHDNAQHTETYVTSADAGPTNVWTGSPSVGNSEKVNIANPGDKAGIGYTLVVTSSQESVMGHSVWLWDEQNNDWETLTKNGNNSLTHFEDDGNINFRNDSSTVNADYQLYGWVL